MFYTHAAFFVKLTSRARKKKKGVDYFRIPAHSEVNDRKAKL